MKQSENRAKQILLRAIELSSPEERHHFIEQECGNDRALQKEVESLLQILEQPEVEQFLEDPPTLVSALADASVISESVGDSIGPYTLTEEIAEGGFGIVFRAEQREPVRRTVALKLIKPGMDTREVIARFEGERQALAAMEHPNIAKVFDGGSTDTGRPFFVMELVKGVPLTRYCDQHQLDTHQRLVLFSQVCKAIHHANKKGIVHRDLKPSNILVTNKDGEPFPIIIDFGISKAISQQLTEKTIFTQSGQLIGTPQYMSPEQAHLGSSDIDCRSDVYSLGVLLYELLTGTTPLESESLRETAYDEICRLIREEDPPTPSDRLSRLGNATASTAALRSTEPAKLRGRIRGELDWIVMKALEKNRDRRYATAEDLARDVESHLNNESVSVSPPSYHYRLRKILHRRGVTAGGVRRIVILLLLLLLLLYWGGVFRNEKAWLNRAQDAAFSPQHAWLKDCKLALLAETGSEIDLDAANIFVNSEGQTLLPPELITSHRNRRADIVGTIRIDGDWLLWEMPLSLNWPAEPNNVDGKLAARDSGFGPKDISLKLRLAVSRSGAFQLGTIGENVNEQLTMLAVFTGMNNYSRFGDAYLPPEEYGSPHDHFIDLDERQNVFAHWFSVLFQKFQDNDLISDGPRHFADLYQCPMTIRNHFNQPIEVKQGFVFHERFNYEFPEVLRPIREAGNRRWSPVPDEPNQDLELALENQLTYEDKQQSVLYLLAASDRNNATSFWVTGLKLDPADYFLFNGDPQEAEASTITVDFEHGTLLGSHKNIAAATVILYDQAPTKIELHATSSWSVVRPMFRFVRLGSAPNADTKSSATAIGEDGSKRQIISPNVPLHTWSIPPSATR